MSHLATRVAESVKSLGVSSVYGEPVELDGVTIIPVAAVQFGFGAGTSDEREDSAGGGGGGGCSAPVGAYVRERNGVRFEPNIIALLAVGIPFVYVTGHALKRIIRALKK